MENRATKYIVLPFDEDRLKDVVEFGLEFARRSVKKSKSSPDLYRSFIKKNLEKRIKGHIKWLKQENVSYL